MSDDSVYLKARAAFNLYAGMDAPALPDDPMSSLQAQHARWQYAAFSAAPPSAFALGFGEEVGEALEALTGLAIVAGRLNHGVLKDSQGVRGFGSRDPEKLRALVADGVADACVFMLGLCTSQRLDFGTLVRETLAEVMARTGATPEGRK